MCMRVGPINVVLRYEIYRCIDKPKVRPIEVYRFYAKDENDWLKRVKYCEVEWCRCYWGE